MKPAFNIYFKNGKGVRVEADYFEVEMVGVLPTLKLYNNTTKSKEKELVGMFYVNEIAGVRKAE